MRLPAVIIFFSVLMLFSQKAVSRYDNTAEDSSVTVESLIYQNEWTFPDSTLLLQQIPRLMDSAGIPGLAIAVGNTDGVWERGFGWRNKTKKQPVTSTTIFEAASLSKPVFTYLVLVLTEQGVLDLDTPLMSYIPEKILIRVFFHSRDIDPRFRLLTARQVLSHKTGLPNFRDPSPFLHFVNNPGEKFTYSGEGLIFLQNVIETLTGKELDQLAHDLVFQPLGMTKSSFIWKKTFADQAATGYDMFGVKSGKSVMKQPVAPYSLYTTVHDYAVFVSALVEKKGLSSSTFAQMLSIQTPLEHTRNWSGSWGLGLGIIHTVKGDYYWHWGDTGNFRNLMIFEVPSGKFMVYMTNSFYGLSIGRTLLDLALGEGQRIFDLGLMSMYYQVDSAEMNFFRTLISKGLKEARKIYASVDFDLLIDYGYQLLEKNDSKKALEFFGFMIDKYPEHYQNYQGMGDAYRQADDIERALSMYRKSLRLNPDNVLVRETVKALESAGDK